jgi:acyl-CoA synthetase (NDP forming)
MKGKISGISQSEDVGGLMVDYASKQRLSFSNFASYDYKASDLRIEDLIEEFAKNEDTRVIVAYIENIDKGRRFIEKVRKVSGSKPVIALKIRGSNKDELYHALFKQAGVLIVDEVEEMFDVAKAFLRLPLPRGRNVGIITGGGGWGVIASDDCEECGLDVPDLLPESTEELNELLPSRWSHGNPVDGAGDVNPGAALKCPEILLKSENINALILMMFAGFSPWIKTGAGAFMPAITRDVGRASRLGLGILFGNIKSFLKTSRNYSNMIMGLIPFIPRYVMAMMIALPMIFKEIIKSSLNAVRILLLKRNVDGFMNLVEDIVSFLFGVLDKENMRMFVKWMNKYEKPILIASLAQSDPRGVLASQEEETGICMFPTPRRALKALSKLADYAEYLARIKENE